jgi:hypothetical protein
MIAGLLPQDRRTRSLLELPVGEATSRLGLAFPEAQFDEILIVLDFDVVDFDAIQNAILALRAVLHPDGRTDFHVRADLFFCESSSATRHIRYVFTITVGHWPTGLLHHEGGTGCILSESSCGGRCGGRCGALGKNHRCCQCTYDTE